MLLLISALLIFLPVTTATENTMPEIIMNTPSVQDFDVRRLILRLVQNANQFSADCRDDLLVLTRSSCLYDPLATNVTDIDVNIFLPMMDASGKFGAGLMHGRQAFTGLYVECTAINYLPGNRTRPFRADYFRAYVDSELRRNNVSGACAATAGLLSVIYASIGLDMCLPKSCSSAELKPVLMKVTFRSDLVQKVSGKLTGRMGGLAPSVIMLVVFVISIAAGIVDYAKTPHPDGRQPEASLAYKCFLSFSLYRNIVQILNTDVGKQEGQINPIHCMRFLSMAWIMIGHTLAFQITDGTNEVDIFALVTDYSSDLMTNAYSSVDTFFFVSGLLLSFVWFKSYNKSPKKTMSCRSWVMLYVHRYIRISAPNFMILMFYTWVFPFMKTGQPRYLAPAYAPDICTVLWWTNIFYLNNYIFYVAAGQEIRCFAITWFLATDMQMFIFTPLILAPLALNKRIGLIVCFVVLALSTAANIITVYAKVFPPSLMSLGPNDPKADIGSYWMYMYCAPYIRCQVYVMGILVGYFLQSTKSIRISRVISTIVWLLAIALSLTVLLGLHSYQNQTYMPIFWRAMYSAFSKIVWGLLLSWMIITCFYGYGGFLNSFLSWPLWAPLGRLTYCAYLLQWLVIDYLCGINTNDMVFSNFTDHLIARAIPAIFVTFFIALFWSALFEVSIAKVESLLFETGTKKKT